MNARVQRLGKVLKDEALAQALAAAGLDTPAKVKAAGDKDLEKIPGVGKATREKIRAKLPKVKAGA